MKTNEKRYKKALEDILTFHESKLAALEKRYGFLGWTRDRQLQVIAAVALYGSEKKKRA